ncbi:MAG TPA: ATPase P [Clostridiales bacterium]|nr:ATPase P [Clostridiales bacterium]
MEEGEAIVEQSAMGLTSEEVAARVAEGKVNGKQDLQTKSVWKILRDNTFTLFNGLNVFLAVLILVVSHGESWNNILFMGIVLFNLSVGIFQELKAKKTIEKLSLISAPRAKVLRDKEEREIPVEELVMDDVMILRAGDQICADSVIADGSVEVNESMITGESDPVYKKDGEDLKSGSFIVSGKCSARVVHVGAENYAHKIAAGARYIKKTNSEILRALRAIIRLMSIIVIPLGIGLFLKEFLIGELSSEEAVLKMSGSVTSMIPQGLIALSTTVFAVGVVRLSAHKVLSQDLYSIETLARVDVLCLDKTGTITEGSMVVTGLSEEQGTEDEIRQALGYVVSCVQDNNPTYLAVSDFVGDAKATPEGDAFPFSSDRKWSGANRGERAYVMGALEFIAPDQAAAYQEKCAEYQRRGQRVICVAETDKIEDRNHLSGVKILGFVLIEDKIRAEAPDTLRFFAEAGVDLRVISGDNPVTVSAIAAKAGLEGAEKYTDAATWGDSPDYEKLAEEYKIFGRVTPEQKFGLIKTLKKQGHTVAMTGDGVNDVLALKEADCSVAMASGSDVAKSVASLVLLDSNFSSMPRVVAEGRCLINNLQRSSYLYLVKTIYATILSIIFLFVGTFPFDPSDMTLVGIAATGIPSFFLALEANHDRVDGGFLYNSLRMSLPGALVIVINVLSIQLLAKPLHLTEQEVHMLSVLIVAVMSFMVLFRVCLPMSIMHAAIFLSMLGVYALGWFIFPTTLSMTPFKDITAMTWYSLLVMGAISAGLFVLFIFLERKLAKRGKPKILKKLKLE